LVIAEDKYNHNKNPFHYFDHAFNGKINKYNISKIKLSKKHIKIFIKKFKFKNSIKKFIWFSFLNKNPEKKKKIILILLFMSIKN
jgi:hypothetical protein